MSSFVKDQNILKPCSNIVLCLSIPLRKFFFFSGSLDNSEIPFLKNKFFSECKKSLHSITVRLQQHDKSKTAAAFQQIARKYCRLKNYRAKTTQKYRGELS